jgi:hypothetical protein
MDLFRDIGRFLEMGVIAHGHPNFNAGASSKLRYLEHSIHLVIVPMVGSLFETEPADIRR